MAARNITSDTGYKDTGIQSFHSFHFSFHRDPGIVSLMAAVDKERES